MNRKKRRRIAATALAALSLVASFWLITLDVYVDERNTDGVPTFCGSAYDVALLKGDGFMGGEVPPTRQPSTGPVLQRRERTWCLQVSAVSRAWLRLPTRCFCRGGPESWQGSRRPLVPPSDGLRRVAATFYD